MGEQVVAKLLCDCYLGTDIGIAVEKMLDDLIFNAIFLRRTSERGCPGLVEIVILGGVECEPSVPNGQLDIPEGEWSGV